MTEKQFRSLIGKNVVVDYPFFQRNSEMGYEKLLC